MSEVGGILHIYYQRLFFSKHLLDFALQGDIMNCSYHFTGDCKVVYMCHGLTEYTVVHMYEDVTYMYYNSIDYENNFK